MSHHSETDYQQKGLRLLAAHYLLTKQGVKHASDSDDKGKRMKKLMKLEEDIESWQKRYRKQFLGNKSLWDKVKNYYEEKEKKKKEKEEKHKEKCKEQMEKEKHEENKEEMLKKKEQEQANEMDRHVRMKRSLEEDEDELKDDTKKAKVGAAGVAVRRVEGHKVLVQHLPDTLHYADLRSYFEQFGTVKKVFLKDGIGCGFIIYESEDVADRVCSLKHELGGQEVWTMREKCSPKTKSPSKPAFEVFVFGLPLNTDTDKLREALSTFGKVVSVVQPCGKNFAFAVFETESGMAAALRTRKITLPDSRTALLRERKPSCGSVELKEGQERKKEEKRPHKEECPKYGYQVFLYGVNIPIDLDTFKLYLAEFGNVVSAFKPDDKRYAFVGFETEEGQHKALTAGAINLPYGRATIKPFNVQK